MPLKKSLRVKADPVAPQSVAKPAAADVAAQIEALQREVETLTAEAARIEAERDSERARRLEIEHASALKNEIAQAPAGYSPQLEDITPAGLGAMSGEEKAALYRHIADAAHQAFAGQ